MFKSIIFKKTLITAFIGVLVLSSCKKDDTQSRTNQPLKLSEFKIGDDVTRFDYNEDGSLKKIFMKEDPLTMDYNVTYTVKYLANNKIDEFIGTNGAKIKLIYSNNTLAKSELYIGSVKISESVFTYFGEQLKTTAIYMFYNNSTIGVPFLKSDFLYNPEGNVNRGNLFVLNPINNQFEPRGFVNNFYDNKINPFALLGDVMLVFWEYASKHNIIKQIYFDENGSQTEMVETIYNYNSQGYPANASMKMTEVGQPPSTTVLSFIYK